LENSYGNGSLTEISALVMRLIYLTLVVFQGEALMSLKATLMMIENTLKIFLNTLALQMY
jgi:hypothetical protein